MELAKDLSAKYQEILTLEIQVVVDNSKDVVFIFVRKPARAGPHLHTKIESSTRSNMLP